MTINETLNLAAIKLKQSTSAALDAEVLLAYILNKPKEYLALHPHKNLLRNMLRNFWKLVAKRMQGQPVAYLTGGKEFYGRKFYVNKNVLIPRPETEGLVELVLRQFKNQNPKIKILEVGTGSGCVAVTLAKETAADIFASDISKPALAVAQKNARRHRAKITFKQGSLLSPWQKQRFDIIVANLPYGWKQWKNNTSAQSIGLRFEPQTALFTKENGLYLIRQLLTQISKLERKPSLVLLEFDPRQTGQIKKLAVKFLPAYETKVDKDLFGRNRYFTLFLP